MHTHFLKFLVLLLVILFLSCKQDKDTATPSVDNSHITEKSESQKYLQRIARAHNATKFSEEAQVKFYLKMTVSDNVFFDGSVSLKTDGTKARFLDSKIDKVIEKGAIIEVIDKKLYTLLELYSIGFWMDETGFRKVSSEDEEFTKAVYNSSVTSSHYEVFTHPLTDIVQHVQFKSELSETPFDEAKVYFDRYITVNRVPVALKWYFTKENDTIAKVEISRISYPDTF